MTVEITDLSPQTVYGTPVSFNVSITIEDPDTYVPISNLSLDINGAVSAEYFFALDGTPLVQNDSITITRISSLTNDYGYGTGYGYDFGTGYRYGYQYW